ncbi:MAG: GrpB family protein [Rhodoglobus sp.]
MPIDVVSYSSDWPELFIRVAEQLHEALRGLPMVEIEHVGSTAVPGLAAKPVLDIDIIVHRGIVDAAIEALEMVGYVHRGDLGVTDREAFCAPDQHPPRNVYVCVSGTLHVRNHLAARNALRADPGLRDRYGAVKLQLASDSTMDIYRYIAGKSAVLQDVLAASDLTADEKQQIYELNTNS